MNRRAWTCTPVWLWPQKNWLTLCNQNLQPADCSLLIISHPETQKNTGPFKVSVWWSLWLHTWREMDSVKVRPLKLQREEEVNTPVFDQGRLRRHACSRICRRANRPHSQCVHPRQSWRIRRDYSWKVQHESAGKFGWNWRAEPLLEFHRKSCLSSRGVRTLSPDPVENHCQEEKTSERTDFNCFSAEFWIYADIYL